MSDAKRVVAMAKYLTLLDDIDRDAARAKTMDGYAPCPSSCHDCCHVAAILPVGAVEIELLLDALASFPAALRAGILNKAHRSTALLEAKGFVEASVAADPTGAPAASLSGRPEGECPFLTGGVCAAYERRPLICRAWGVPMDTGGESADCCPKTWRGGTIPREKAVPYLDYWRKARTLSGSLGSEAKEPMAFGLLRRWRERERRDAPAVTSRS